MTNTVGVIGLGNMGRGMALSLQRGGFSVVGTDALAATRGWGRAAGHAGVRLAGSGGRAGRPADTSTGIPR